MKIPNILKPRNNAALFLGATLSSLMRIQFFLPTWPNRLSHSNNPSCDVGALLCFHPSLNPSPPFLWKLLLLPSKLSNLSSSFSLPSSSHSLCPSSLLLCLSASLPLASPAAASGLFVPPSQQQAASSRPQREASPHQTTESHNTTKFQPHWAAAECNERCGEQRRKRPNLKPWQQKLDCSRVVAS